MPKTQSRWSLDDLLFPVNLIIPDGANPDPALDVVQFQLVLGGLPARAQPTEPAWMNGFWLPAANGVLYAGVLVGPGGTLTPAPGRWAVWIRVVDNPTIPVAAIDQLTVT